MARVTLNYWAGARSAAGVERDVIEADSLAAALDVLRAHHEDRRFSDVLAVSSLMVDGRVLGPVDREAELDTDVEVDVLPPFAGGSHISDAHSTM